MVKSRLMQYDALFDYVKKFVKLLSLLAITSFHFSNNKNVNENGKKNNNNKINKNCNGNLDSTVEQPQQQNESNEKASAYFGQFKRFFQLSIICSTLCIQLISFGLIMNNIDDNTPLVLFSWWRNKIS